MRSIRMLRARPKATWGSTTPRYVSSNPRSRTFAAAVRRYFGETAVGACGQCDLCLNPPEATDVTVAAQKALSAVHRLGGRFGRGRIVDHLLGRTKDVLASETQLSTFGIGREFSAAGWSDLLD